MLLEAPGPGGEADLGIIGLGSQLDITAHRQATTSAASAADLTRLREAIDAELKRLERATRVIRTATGHVDAAVDAVTVLKNLALAYHAAKTRTGQILSDVRERAPTCRKEVPQLQERLRTVEGIARTVQTLSEDAHRAVALEREKVQEELTKAETLLGLPREQTRSRW